MSRIGKKPVSIPKEVKVQIKTRQVEITGPKGVLVLKTRPEVEVTVENDQIIVLSPKKDKPSRAFHGLTRALLANMVQGVTEGFSKTLKLVGTGYRVKLEGENLVLSLGFSHPVEIEPINGIQLEVQGNDTIKIDGIDKALVGQIAAKIRAIKPPEPYKGKGIRYQDEHVKRKAGKAAAVVGGE